MPKLLQLVGQSSNVADAAAAVSHAAAAVSFTEAPTLDDIRDTISYVGSVIVVPQFQRELQPTASCWNVVSHVLQRHLTASVRHKATVPRLHVATHHAALDLVL